MNKPVLISLVFSGLIIGGAFFLATPRVPGEPGSVIPPIAEIVDGVQIVAIRAKGGYSPRVVTAKAGMPTLLRITTDGTFDCSASLVIPKISYQKFLPSSGTEEIRISPEQAQGTLQGLCSMGMYNFRITFEP